MGDDMQEYREVFLSESAEYLQAMTDGLLALENEPNDLEPVETVFRGAHSLKGMAAAMGYARTQELTHKMESLMDTVRQRVQSPDHELIDLMLRAIDAVRDLIVDESTGAGEVNAEEIVTEVVARTQGARTVEDSSPIVSASPAESTAEGALMRVRVTIEESCVLKGVRAYMAIKRLTHMGSVVDTEPSAREIEDEQFDRSFVVVFRTQATPDAVRSAVLGVTEVEDVAVEQVASTPAETTASVIGRSTAATRSVPKLSETQTVRVSIGHLDSMVNLVGELVIIRSRLERIARSAGLPELSDTIGAFERISAELQQEVMLTRMVPVGNIFNRFPRMVRDLARDLGKDVAFETEGLDIELDRTVLDEIGDPIVHLLRNAVDHAIEHPDERAEAGKPERGTIRLIAERERDQVLITVSDDGRGMDAERIWQTAVSRGLVEAGARSAYSDQDVLMLVCSPGFSTVEKATRVSGRGVGMDVVKGKIEYLGGTVGIHSQVGEGTTVSLRLPLTLAIIQALLVACDEQVYAIPLGAVDEVLGLDEVEIETIENRWVAVLRDKRVVPIQRLDVVCGISAPGGHAPTPGDHIVIVRSGEESRALAVARLIGRQEVVIKPLSPLFKGLRGFGGATVLGDGRVALIIDPRTLFRLEA